MPLPWITSEHYKAMGDATRRRLSSPEGHAQFLAERRAPATRAKIVEANKRRAAEGRHPWTGRKHSAAARAKMSAAARARTARGDNPIIGWKHPFRDTLPEQVVQSFLRESGIEFTTHRAIPGNAHPWDAVIHPAHTLIEVDGCYWHGCEQCGHGDSKHANKARDAELTAFAESAGWKLIRVWEHDAHPAALAAILQEIA